MTATAVDVNDSDKDPASTLVLLGEQEFVLRASRSRVVFENYNRAGEASIEQLITLKLDNGLAQQKQVDSPAADDDVSVPILLSAPSTARFELFLHDSTSSFEAVLSRGSPLTCIIRFKRPGVSESDYAWDNFQDRFVVHTRLSKLVIRLEAWKNEVILLSRDQDNSVLFPASLPEAKAPPLRLFGAIERNAVRQRASSPGLTEITKTSLVSEQNSAASNNLEAPRSPRTEALPPLSRPGSSERQSSLSVSLQGNPVVSSSVNAGSVPHPEVTAVQSLREAREVIMKLRRRRTVRSTLRAPGGDSPTSVTETDLYPETEALDANTKADLEEFNNLVLSARDHVTKEAVKAKNELAYYQQLIPVLPPRGSTPETPSPIAQKSKETRQMSAATKRPSKLPSLVRPSSSAAPASASSEVDPLCPMNNQEMSPLEQVSQLRKCSARQRILRTTKLKSLSASVDGAQGAQQQKEAVRLPATTSKRRRSINNQLQQEQVDELSDFDDPDPEVDDAPILPDELSGVAALEADELL